MSEKAEPTHATRWRNAVVLGAVNVGLLAAVLGKHGFLHVCPGELEPVALPADWASCTEVGTIDYRSWPAHPTAPGACATSAYDRSSPERACVTSLGPFRATVELAYHHANLVAFKNVVLEPDDGCGDPIALADSGDSLTGPPVVVLFQCDDDYVAARRSSGPYPYVPASEIAPVAFAPVGPTEGWRLARSGKFFLVASVLALPLVFAVLRPVKQGQVPVRAFAFAALSCALLAVFLWLT